MLEMEELATTLLGPEMSEHYRSLHNLVIADSVYCDANRINEEIPCGTEWTCSCYKVQQIFEIILLLSLESTPFTEE